MRLRDVGGFCSVVLVLVASSGCHAIHLGQSQTYQPKQNKETFKSDPVTKKEQAENQVALAQEYMQQGQNDIALEDLQKAIKLDPASADAYTLLGVLDERLNRLDQAGAAYTKSASLAPTNGIILNNYGGWLCRSGHAAEADPVFRKALADPFYKSPGVALENAASCAFQAGRADLAEGYDRQILAVDPNSTVALFSMASIEYQHNDYLHARGFIERTLAAGKTAPESLDLAAHIEDKLGDQDSARNYRSRLGAEFPQYTPGKF